MSAPSGVADGLLRVLGGLIGFMGGLVAGLLAVLLVPLRLGDAGRMVGWFDGLDGLDGTTLGAVRVPVAVVVAVVVNLILIRFAERATGVRWGVLLPGLGWFVVVVAALWTTAERDRLLLPDDWVATLTLFAGTTAVVIGMVFALVTPSRAPVAAGRSAGVARESVPARE